MKFSRLIAACERVTESERTRAIVLTLLYTGLRIGDTAQLERHKLQSDGRLLLRIEKTGRPVYVRLHPDCIAALNALPVTGTYFFLNGKRKLSSETQMIRNK